MVDEKTLKDNYLKAAKESMSAGNDNTVYTMEMLEALKDMADEGVWPDGRFGDNDCIIWDWFCR